MKFTLPIYKKKKSKKGKKESSLLLGLNAYRNMHYRTSNSLKKWYEKLVHKEILDEKYDVYDGEYEMNYLVYYKNPVSDLGNIGSIADKFTQDALQSAGVVTNDNVKHCTRIVFEVGGQDKDSPRVEVTFKKRRKC